MLCQMLLQVCKMRFGGQQKRYQQSSRTRRKRLQAFSGTGPKQLAMRFGTLQTTLILNTVHTAWESVQTQRARFRLNSLVFTAKYLEASDGFQTTKVSKELI